jgi:toxin ParE1/3/4
MKPVRFHPAALAEFAEAAHYYEDKQKGLGIRFIDAIETALLRIKNHTLIFRIIEGNLRKCHVIRFPYGVIFQEKEGCIEIIAIMHLRREPDYWKSRV